MMDEKKEELVDKEYKCLKCGSSWKFKVKKSEAMKVKNKRTCVKCRRNKKLIRKANKRGRKKTYYLK